MIQCHIKQNGIELPGKISVPENAHDMSYGMYLDYVFMQQEISEWVLKQMDMKRSFDYQYATKLAKCIGIVYNIKYDIINKMKYKDLSALDVLWGRIEKIVQDFKPTETSGKFTVGGTEYTIPDITKAYFVGTNNLPELSVQQLEQIGDAENKLQTAIATIDAMDLNHPEIKGDTINKAIKKAQVTFNNTLKKIALCATPIEKVPTDMSFDMWIEAEAKKLTKISMHDALNTLFFLSGMSKESELLIGLNSISSLLNSGRSTAKHSSNTRNEEAILQT